MPRPSSVAEKPATRPASPLERKLAQLGRVTQTDDLSGELPGAVAPDAGLLAEKGKRAASLRHTSDAKIVVYDDQGYPLYVGAGELLQALQSGAHLECPKCGGEHDSTDPNACPKRERVKYYVCPICREHGRFRPIYDDLSGVQVAQPDDDPNAIQLDLSKLTTPEERLKARWQEHARTFHPSEAKALGVPGPYPQ